MRLERVPLDVQLLASCHPIPTRLAHVKRGLCARHTLIPGGGDNAMRVYQTEIRLTKGQERAEVG